MSSLANSGDAYRSAPPAPSSQRNRSPQGLTSGQSLFLTRTVTNYQASPTSSASASRGWASSVAKVAPSFSRSGQYGPDDMEIMDDEPPPRIRLSNSLQSRLDSNEDQPRYKLIVSNLQPTVTTEDIAELFSDIATPLSAKMTSV